LSCCCLHILFCVEFMLHGVDFTAYGVVLSVQVVFAIYQLMTKVAFERYGMDPLAFAETRMVGAAVVLLVVTATIVPKDQFWPRREHRWRFLLMALCMFGNIIGLVFALKCTSSAMVAMLQILRPIFAGILSWSLGLERPTLKKLLGLAICVTGGIAITYYSHSMVSSSGSSPVLGAGLVCIHALSVAAYVLHQPYLVDLGYSALAVNAHSYSLAAFFTAMLLQLPALKPMHHGVWYDSSSFYVLLVLHSILFVAIWSYVAMAWAAKRLGGTTVMLFMLLQAVLVLFAGRYILGEVLQPGQLVGGLFVLVGLLVFVHTEKPKSIDSEERDAEFQALLTKECARTIGKSDDCNL